LVLLVASSATQAGCSDEPDSNIGDLMLALTLPGGATVRKLTFQVLSSKNEVLAAGTMDISDSTSTPTIHASVPASKQDTLTMSTVASDGSHCSGTSAPFDVKAKKTVYVPVKLICTPIVPGQTQGSVIATGTIVPGDVCPRLTSWVAAPLQTSVGASVDVSAGATDPDVGDRLTFLWSASSGSFADPSASKTHYVCGAAGTQTLTVQVSDNHEPAPCTDAHTMTVMCGPGT
jgi:hypothetical protein